MNSHIYRSKVVVVLGIKNEDGQMYSHVPVVLRHSGLGNSGKVGV